MGIVRHEIAQPQGKDAVYVVISTLAMNTTAGRVGLQRPTVWYVDDIGEEKMHSRIPWEGVVELS